MSENNDYISEKLDKLNALNEKFYGMFGRLFRNRKLLDNEKTFKHIGAILFEQYKAEYEALKYKYEIKELPELEEVKQKHFELVPRRWRPWWLLFLFRFRNRAAKNIDRKIFCEMEEHFLKVEVGLKKREEALERLEAALDKASENCNPFDEPAEQGTPENEQKLAENVEKQEPKQTDKPAETKPEKTKKAKSEPKGSEQLRGQMTLDDVQSQTEQQKP